MGDIKITKKDVMWGYIGQFFQIGSGIITLPLVLRLLTPDEVGMNYLMLTISTMVALLDFGFSGQFGLNFTFVNSGAQRLLKEGVEHIPNGEVNYHLLSVLLKTAQMVYRRLSLICFLIMVTAGTGYIYHVTDGFKNVNNAFSIWLLFSLSTYFNIYFTYYNSLLRGSGLIACLNKATIFSKAVYLILVVILLYAGWGLFSIVIANFIAPFILRWYCYKIYFTKERTEKIEKKVDKFEIKDTFSILWYNAKRQGLNTIGGYFISKSSLFVIGFYLPLESVGSYGLLIQLTSILNAMAQSLFNTYIPKFSNYRVLGQMDEFKRLMSSTLLVYLVVVVLGYAVIIMLGPIILAFIHSRTELPVFSVMVIYCVAMVLEGLHSNFAVLITSKNEVPFVKASLLSGMCIICLTIMILQITSWELFGVVLVPFIVQLCYNNWRWPKWIFDELNMSIFDFFKIGSQEINRILNNK